MTQYLEYPVADAVTLGKNRRGVLIGFGVTGIVMGVLCALVTLAGVGGMMLQFAQFGVRPSWRDLVELALGGLFFLVLAGGMTWVGVAMVRCRRWVAPVGFAASTLWLVVGVILVESLAVWLVASDWDDLKEEWIILTGMGVLAMMANVLPAAYVLVFTRPGVRQTLEAYHPYPVWTDRYPTPVVVAGVWGLLLGLFLLGDAGRVEATVFGRVVTDGWAVAVSLSWAAAVLGMGAACFARPGLGWGLAVVVLTLSAASVVWSAVAAPPPIGPGAPADEVEAAMRPWRADRINRCVLAAGCWLGGTWFLWRTRRAFGGVEAPAARAIPAAQEEPGPAVT